MSPSHNAIRPAAIVAILLASGAFAQQTWPGTSQGNTLSVAVCAACNKYSLWVRDNASVDAQMVWPDDVDVPPPNQDLDDDIKTDYLEASWILNK